MKILLVTHYFPSHRGGVEIVAGNLARRLSASGALEIDWYASDTDETPESAPGLRFHPVKCNNFFENHAGFPWPIWPRGSFPALREAVRAADIVHLHDYAYMGNIAVMRWARRYRKPVVITQHIGFIPYKNPFLRLLLSVTNRTLGRRMHRSASRVVFISETVKEYFSRGGKFAAPPLLIHNGVDTKTFFPAGDAARKRLREQLGCPEPVPLLLFVGRFVEKKGLPVLKELCARVPGAQWHFVGWGPFDPAAWKMPNVRVHYHLPPQEIVPLYQAADLLVLPSQGEGFPLVVQEAMACGTPVLVGTETADACRAAKPLMFWDHIGPDTVREWTGRLTALLSSPENLRAMRPRIADFARASWSWEKCAEQYLGIFRGLR